MRNNKAISLISIVFLFFALHLGSVSYAEVQGAPAETATTIDSSIDEALNNEMPEEIKTPRVKDIQEMTPNANEKIRKEVVGDTTDHFKMVVKRFLAAMAGVVVSSLLLFLILMGMNKFHLIKPQKKEEIKQEPEDISPSNDENDALKIFFDKTK